MRPGGWFVEPLLLPGEGLEERIAADAERAQALGHDPAGLGGRLGELLEGAGESDWFSPAVRERFRVEIRRRRGILTCPWAPEEYARCAFGDGGKRAGANGFVVRNAETGATLEGFVLSAHLIAEHGFFGGAETAFRIEPEDLAALLG